MKPSRFSSILATTLLLLTICHPAYGQLATKKALTLDVARKLAAAAEAEAQKNNWTIVVAILDDGANLYCLERMDGTQIGSIDVAIQKARASVAFKRPTKVFEDLIGEGRTSLLGLPGTVPVEGGLPLFVDGQLVGAIGISGVTSQQDGQIARAGVAAFEGLAR